MPTLTVTAKGQVTLRKDILEHLGVGPGEQISVAKLPDGGVVVRAAPSGKISDTFGLLKKSGRAALSIDEMNEIARQGWSSKAPKKK
jgi:AbrB family looped-hinge helix DNA binding protein